MKKESGHYWCKKSDIWGISSWKPHNLTQICTWEKQVPSKVITISCINKMSRTHRTSSLQIKVSKEKVVGKLKEKRAIRVLFCVILRMVSSWDWDSFYYSYSEKKSPSSLLRMLTLHTLVSVLLWYARMRVTLKLWQEDPRVLPKKRIWRHIEPELRDLFFY